MRAALAGAFLSLAAPALAQESSGGSEERSGPIVSGSVNFESADTLPTNLVVNQNPTLDARIDINQVIGNATATLEGQANFDLSEGAFTRGQWGVCVSRVFNELFAKGCLRQGVNLETFTATTEQFFGILAGPYGVVIAGDYNLADGSRGQYIEAGRDFHFQLGENEFTLTPMVGHEPQDDYTYGYLTMTTPVADGRANLSFRLFGDENDALDGSVPLSVPFGGDRN